MNLESILTSDDIVETIRNNMDYLLLLIPEIKDMIGFDQHHPHHHLDVWEHTLYALSLSDNDFEIRLVLLLHDIGKPHSYIDTEVRHFPNHANVSMEISKNILNRLGYNQEFNNEVLYLIKEHDSPITIKEIQENYALAYKKYLVQYSDALAHHPDKLEKRKEYLKRMRKMFDER